jgi:2-hydroxychromene-2-carboxylate isomerase
MNVWLHMLSLEVHAMTLQPLYSDAPAIVYIDFKSPYAYLAIEPTRELERELGVRFDWRPFVLDIPSYLGSARLGKSGEVVEQKRSAEQWSGVKYAYYDCRRYARLRNMTIRGTEKIWDTNLVSTAMLWARQQGYDALHRFIDGVYPAFWKRELDVECEQVIACLLSDIGANGTEFIEWAQSEGLAQNTQLQNAAFDAGIYGVPTYVVGGELYFGREHLPRVRWQLNCQSGARPDIAYTLPCKLPALSELPSRISIGVDDSLDSLLALPKLTALLANYSGTIDWVRVPSRKAPLPPPDDDRSRRAMHKRLRSSNQAACIRRYGSSEISPKDYAQAIEQYLRESHISLADKGPDQIVRPAMPGIVVLLGDELFIGRQHLPLLAARLTVAGPD